MRPIKLLINLALIFLLFASFVFANNGSWVNAGEIIPGDWLFNSKGEWIQVKAVRHTQLENLVSVFNLEVEGTHNYFVGLTSVLVHNKGGGEDGVKNLLELFDNGASSEEVINQLKKIEGVKEPPIHPSDDFSDILVLKIKTSKLYGHANEQMREIFARATHQAEIDPVLVVRVGNDYMISDGVGRATRAILKGQTEINARVIREYDTVADLMRSKKTLSSVDRYLWNNQLSWIDSKETIKRLETQLSNNIMGISKAADDVVAPIFKELDAFEKTLLKDKETVLKKLDELGNKILKRTDIAFTASQKEILSESIIKFHPKLRAKILVEIEKSDPKILKEVIDYFKGSRINYVDYLLLERYTGKNSDVIKYLSNRGYAYTAGGRNFGVMGSGVSFRGIGDVDPEKILIEGMQSKGTIDDLAGSVKDINNHAWIHGSKSVIISQQYGNKVFFIISNKGKDVNNVLKAADNSHPEEDIIAYLKNVYSNELVGYKDYSKKASDFVENINPEAKRAIDNFNTRVIDDVYEANAEYSKSWADKAKKLSKKVWEEEEEEIVETMVNGAKSLLDKAVEGKTVEEGWRITTKYNGLFKEFGEEAAETLVKGVNQLGTKEIDYLDLGIRRFFRDGNKFVDIPFGEKESIEFLKQVGIVENNLQLASKKVNIIKFVSQKKLNEIEGLPEDVVLAGIADYEKGIIYLSANKIFTPEYIGGVTLVHEWSHFKFKEILKNIKVELKGSWTDDDIFYALTPIEEFYNNMLAKSIVKDYNFNDILELTVINKEKLILDIRLNGPVALPEIINWRALAEYTKNKEKLKIIDEALENGGLKESTITIIKQISKEFAENSDAFTKSEKEFGEFIEYFMGEIHKINIE